MTNMKSDLQYSAAFCLVLLTIVCAIGGGIADILYQDDWSLFLARCSVVAGASSLLLITRLIYKELAWS